MTSAPAPGSPESPFSSHNPRLQTAWDSTSFRALMFCPRYYEYTILDGWQGASIDLEFGILAHTALEVFDHARLDGQSRDEAQLQAVIWAMKKSGYRDPEGYWVPWGGFYLDGWRCAGKIKSPVSGRPIKCPYSKQLNPGPAPSICAECGDTPVEIREWVPYDPAKDRYTLVRLVAWFCEEQPEDSGDGVQPFVFPDGTRGIELSFRFPLGFKTPGGDDYLLCGHMDGLCQFGPERFVKERKTTKRTLSSNYFKTFSPNIQMDIYDLAGATLYAGLGLKGVLLEALQTMVGGFRSARRVLYRSEAQREELYNELRQWLDLAERYAEADYWPMNRVSCAMCHFKGICSMEPAARSRFLEASFERRHWNPLRERSS